MCNRGHTLLSWTLSVAVVAPSMPSEQIMLQGNYCAVPLSDPFCWTIAGYKQALKDAFFSMSTARNSKPFQAPRNQKMSLEFYIFLGNRNLKQQNPAVLKFPGSFFSIWVFSTHLYPLVVVVELEATIGWFISNRQYFLLQQSRAWT